MNPGTSCAIVGSTGRRDKDLFYRLTPGSLEDGRWWNKSGLGVVDNLHLPPDRDPQPLVAFRAGIYRPAGQVAALRECAAAKDKPIIDLTRAFFKPRTSPSERQCVSSEERPAFISCPQGMDHLAHSSSSKALPPSPASAARSSFATSAVPLCMTATHGCVW